MSVPLRHVNHSLQHEYTERDPGNPADEAEDVENAEDQKDNASRPVPSGKHVNGRDKAKYNVEDAGDPDELLGELARRPDVRVAEDSSHAENECEKDNRVGIEREIVSIVAVDASTVGSRCIKPSVFPLTCRIANWYMKY